MEELLMGVRIRESDTIAELKEMRQKVMELETQVRAVFVLIFMNALVSVSAFHFVCVCVTVNHRRWH